MRTKPNPSGDGVVQSFLLRSDPKPLRHWQDRSEAGSHNPGPANPGRQAATTAGHCHDADHRYDAGHWDGKL